jgi:hypothetical protein
VLAQLDTRFFRAVCAAVAVVGAAAPIALDRPAKTSAAQAELLFSAAGAGSDALAARASSGSRGENPGEEPPSYRGQLCARIGYRGGGVAGCAHPVTGAEIRAGAVVSSGPASALRIGADD